MPADELNHRQRNIAEKNCFTTAPVLTLLIVVVEAGYKINYYYYYIITLATLLYELITKLRHWPSVTSTTHYRPTFLQFLIQSANHNSPSIDSLLFKKSWEKNLKVTVLSVIRPLPSGIGFRLQLPNLLCLYVRQGELHRGERLRCY